MPVLERDVDRGVVSWAKEKWPKMIVRKLTTLGARGIAGDPDRLFLWKGKLLLIEMKAPGEACTELQIHRQAEWRAAGAEVMVCDTVAAGRSVLLQFYEGRRRQYSGVPRATPW